MSVNCTVPRARPMGGASGAMRTSLPARVTLPCTLDWSMWLTGSDRASCRSAVPLAVVLSSALPVRRASGEVVTNDSMSASGPRASAFTATTVWARSGMRASTLFTRSFGVPAKLPLAPFTAMVDRSKIRSPVSSVRAGQGASLACCRRGGT